MDRREAEALLTGELADWRRRPYGDLFARVGSEPVTYELRGDSGVLYQLEIQVFRDGDPDGTLRVIGAIDDGGLRAFVPLCEDFLVSPDGGPGPPPGRQFAEFLDTPRGTEPPDLAVRPARPEDAEAVGRLSAAREGGDAREHASGFRRALEGADLGRASLVLAAEAEGRLVGFSKAAFFGGPDRPDPDVTPEGFYLTGVVVDPAVRRRGVGHRLTGERLRWIAERSDSAYYFSNARNAVSIALHRSFGFVEVARGPRFAGVAFTGGEGILFRADLPGPAISPRGS